MARSVLLQLVRDAIEEVMQLQQHIDITQLLHDHPPLEESIPATVEIFLEKELRGKASVSDFSLAQNINLAAKKAAFEDKRFTPLKTSEYPHVMLKLTLHTTQGEIAHTDAPLFLS